MTEQVGAGGRDGRSTQSASMASGRPSIHEHVHRWREWLRVPLVWFGMATLAWFGTLLLATSLVHGTDGISIPTATYFASLALVFSLAGCIPVAGLQLLTSFLRRAPRLRIPLPALCGALLAAWPAWEQATFLTSGDGISAHPYVGFIWVGFFVCFLVATALLWVWHVLGTRPAPHSTKTRAAVALTLWYAIGLGCAAVLFVVISRHLQTYAFFASALLGPLWLLVSTLLYRTFHRLRRAATTVAVVAVLAAFFGAASPGAPDAFRSLGREQTIDQVTLVGAVDLALSSPAHNVARFDLTGLDNVTCPEPSPSARLAPVKGLEPRRKRNVIFVTVDALRADAPSWKVGDRPLLPHTDAFVQKSLCYRKATATYPATLFAVGGALTGLYPSDLLFAPGLPDNILRLSRDSFDAQILVFPSSTWFDLPIVDGLIFQGTQTTSMYDAEQQTDELIRRLQRARRRGENVFAWIHYYEPHPRYLPHQGFSFGSTKEALYRGEIAYVDFHLGRLMAYLDRARWLDDSLVVFFADHGQSVGERQYYGHHVFLNRWIIDVPLCLHGPTIEAGTSDEVVSLIDLAPTVLHFLDLPIPQNTPARSLFEPLEAGRVVFAEAFPIRGRHLFDITNDRITTLEGLDLRIKRISAAAKNYSPRVSLITKRHRLIVDRATGVSSLYDRQRDPEEETNLSRSHPQLHTKLMEQLARWHKTQSKKMRCSVLSQQGPTKVTAPLSGGAALAQPD